MTRSRSLMLSFAAAAAVLLSSAMATVHDVVATTCSAVKRAASWMFDLVMPSMPEPMKTRENQPLPEVALVQAVAFVDRMVKRERPQVRPGWRMCPSI